MRAMTPSFGHVKEMNEAGLPPAFLIVTHASRPSMSRSVKFKGGCHGATTKKDLHTQWLHRFMGRTMRARICCLVPGKGENRTTISPSVTLTRRLRVAPLPLLFCFSVSKPVTAWLLLAGCSWISHF